MSRKFNQPTGESCRTSVQHAMESPSAKGSRSEAALLAALVAAGKTVLLPWGAHHRYDFVVDEGDGRFLRVQCKTGVLRDGAIWFRTASADRRRPSGDAYIGQIEAFAVHCPELGRSFLVPIAAVRATQRAALRVTPTLSNQASGIRWASLYELLGARQPTLIDLREPESERKTRFELATLALARRCATAAPLPLEQPE